jgi:AraC-like DNA-binding protein/GGDEF domain-containing protein
MKRLIPRSTYIRIFVVLGILCSIIISIFSLFLTKQFSKYSLQEINSITESQLQQAIINTEFTLNKLKSYSINIYQDPEIMNWLSASSSSTVVDYNAILALRRYINSEPFIDNIYLINNRTEKTLDYKLGVYSNDAFPDRGILQFFEQEKPEYFRYFYHEVKGKPHWGVILPPDVYRAEYYGSLVILLDLKVVGEYFQNSGNSDVQIAIMDADGNSVLGKADESWYETIRRNASESKASHFRFTYEGQAYYADTAYLNTNTWKLYYVISMEKWFHKVDRFTSTILISSSLVLSALILILFWNSRRHFKPLSFLAQTVQQFTSGSREERPYTSEYEVIKQGIDHLVHSRDEMMSAIRDHESLIMSEHIRGWILQGNMNSSMRSYVEKKTSLFQCEYIQLSVMRIDNYSEFKDKYNFESRKLMKYAMGNIAQEVLQDERWSSEVVDMGGDHIVLLIGSPIQHDEAENIADSLIQLVLLKVKDQIRNWLDIQVTLAISSRRETSDDLQLSYNNMYELTTFKFISGEDRIYQEHDLEVYDTIVQPPDDAALLEDIIQAVRLGQAESVRSYLDVLFAPLQHLSYIKCKSQLVLIMHTLMRAFRSSLSLQSAKGILIDLDRFTTLQAFREWLENQLELVMQSLQENSHSGRKEELVKEMIEYMDNHLHSFQLNIEEVADHVSLSAGYVRQLFKEVSHTSVSDYILNKRIELICNLLTETDWTVAEIAKRSGFQTRSHFFTVFKKNTGMTPNQYREVKRII